LVSEGIVRIGSSKPVSVPLQPALLREGC